MTLTIQLPSNERISLDDEVLLIGSDIECHIFLPEYNVLPRHAKIENISGRWLIKSEGEWGLQVNNDPITNMAWLKEGDTIWLTPDGPKLIFEPREDQLEVSSPPMPKARRQSKTTPASQATLSPVPSNKTTKERKRVFKAELPMITLVLVVFVSLMAFFTVRMSTKNKADMSFNFAERLWAQGKKKEAVSEFAEVVDFLPEGVRLVTAYQQIVEYNLETRNYTVAESMMEEAESRGITLAIEPHDDESKTLLKRTEVARSLKEANFLWDDDEKADAVDRYRFLINHKLGWLDETGKALVLKRVIDYDAANGRKHAAKDMIQMAMDEGIVLSLESLEAVTIEKELSKSRSEDSNENGKTNMNLDLISDSGRTNNKQEKHQEASGQNYSEERKEDKGEIDKKDQSSPDFTGSGSGRNTNHKNIKGISKHPKKIQDAIQKNGDPSADYSDWRNIDYKHGPQGQKVVTENKNRKVLGIRQVEIINYYVGKDGKKYLHGKNEYKSFDLDGVLSLHQDDNYAFGLPHGNHITISHGENQSGNRSVMRAEIFYMFGVGQDQSILIDGRNILD